MKKTIKDLFKLITAIATVAGILYVARDQIKAIIAKIKEVSDDDFDDDFFDEEDDDIEEKPKKRFFRKLENEDEDEEEEPQAKPVHTAPRKQSAPKTTASSQAAAARAPKPAAPVSSKVTPMRKKAGALNMEVCVIKPASMEDTREIADTLLAGCTVVLNLEGIDVDIAQRIIDFCCGACYCMSGSLQETFCRLPLMQ